MYPARGILVFSVPTYRHDMLVFFSPTSAHVNATKGFCFFVRQRQTITVVIANI